MDPRIPHSVDQLLLEQGEYLPLELLLAEGRLIYSDYESWRNGEVVSLDDRLFGDPEQIKEELSQAAAYARALRLTAETLDYPPWGGGAALRFSADQVLDELFRKAYRKGADHPQLDLFIDGAGSSLANAIAGALGRRDNTEAEQLLAKLYRAEPGHPRLGALERLVEWALLLEQAVADPEWELTELREEIQPLAADLLGKECRNYLAPLWRRIDNALRDRPFDPNRPLLHRSYTSAAVLDWEATLAAVEAEPGWRDDPVLLKRHESACGHLRRPADALLDRFELCWRFPQEAALSHADAAPDLVRAWDRFLELEPELEIPLFPAWLLVVRPQMAQWLPAPNPSDPEDYRLIYALQQAAGAAEGAPSGDAVKLRARLKELDLPLFKHFVANLQR